MSLAGSTTWYLGVTAQHLRTLERAAEGRRINLRRSIWLGAVSLSRKLYILCIHRSVGERGFEGSSTRTQFRIGEGCLGSHKPSLCSMLCFHSPQSRYVSFNGNIAVLCTANPSKCKAGVMNPTTFVHVTNCPCKVLQGAYNCNLPLQWYAYGQVKHMLLCMPHMHHLVARCLRIYRDCAGHKHGLWHC